MGQAEEAAAAARVQAPLAAAAPAPTSQPQQAPAQRPLPRPIALQVPALAVPLDPALCTSEDAPAPTQARVLAGVLQLPPKLMRCCLPKPYM